MGTLRKRCRALACPRKIRDDELFCSTHLGILADTRYIEPIAENREANSAAVAKRILTGTAEAVGYLAKLEGKSAELEAARKAAPRAGEGAITTPDIDYSSGQATYAEPRFLGERQQN